MKNHSTVIRTFAIAFLNARCAAVGFSSSKRYFWEHAPAVAEVDKHDLLLPVDLQDLHERVCDLRCSIHVHAVSASYLRAVQVEAQPVGVLKAWNFIACFLFYPFYSTSCMTYGPPCRTTPTTVPSMNATVLFIHAFVLYTANA